MMTWAAREQNKKLRKLVQELLDEAGPKYGMTSEYDEGCVDTLRDVADRLKKILDNRE
jgi:hypothetical protein